MYYSFLDRQSYQLNFKIYQLFDSVFECLFFWFMWTLKTVELLMQARKVPLDLLQSKLRFRNLIVSTVAISYISLKINDIFLYWICGSDQNSKIVFVIEVLQDGFNIFFFQILKMFLVLYFWRMILRYLRVYFNESNKYVFVYVHLVMLFSMVVYFNEFTYLAYVRLNDYMDRPVNRGYFDT